MSIQFNNANGPGPLARLIAFLIMLFTVFALFGFAVVVLIFAKFTEGNDAFDRLFGAVGMIT